MEIGSEEKKFLLGLVRQVLRDCVGQGKKPEELDIEVPSGQLAEPCGAFVTYYLEKNGQKELRGCIGLMEGIYPLWKTVLYMAHAAAFNDTRFLPLTKGELPWVTYEITVLTPFVPCADIEDIELGRHGIMFACGGRRAVFLPQVPVEQGWTKTQTLEFLALKAGLAPQAWQDSRAEFYVFEGIVLA